MFAHDEVYDTCWGGKSPHGSHPPKTKVGRRNTTFEKLRKKRRVGNTYGHLGTRLNSDVTSVKSPLGIEGVKDGNGQANLACCSVKLKGYNGGKKKGAAPAPAEHTPAPVHLACLAVNTCCECGPTLTCKTARCECRKAARVCVTSGAWSGVSTARPRPDGKGC